MAKANKEKLPYTHAEFEAELVRLKNLLGRLGTDGQIKAACLQHETIEQSLVDNKLQIDAFWEYIRKLAPRADPRHHRIWDEITLNDRMGATSQELVDGQKLDQQTFVELGRTLDVWKRLDGDRGLSLLVDGAELSAAKIELEAERISGAEFFSIFLRLEKVKSGVKQWDSSTLYDLRCRLHKCVKQMEGRRVTRKIFPESSPTSHELTTKAILPNEPPILRSDSGIPTETINISKSQYPRKRRSLSDLTRWVEDLRGRAGKRAAENLRFQNAQVVKSTRLIASSVENDLSAEGPFIPYSAVTTGPRAQVVSQENFDIDKTVNIQESEPAELPQNNIAEAEERTCISTTALSSRGVIVKPKENPFAKAMRQFEDKVRRAEERLASSKQLAVVTLPQIESVKGLHGVIVEEVKNQNLKLWMLCYAIKDDWSVHKIEAAVAACTKYEELRSAILEKFGPILMYNKALRDVEEAEAECAKWKMAYDNMNEVNKLMMEEGGD